MEANKLIKETSPYLLQHAYNPVKWYPWGDEALMRAKEENKPIFLSVGYSACHWCHVMAHESFENEEIAQVMNENFINIKVDREERPDIDDIYQKVCQLTTRSGCWPLSVFLTPDQRPFYVGTYFPPLDSYGRPGFGSIVRQLVQAWKEKPNDVESTAENFLNTLKKTEAISLPSKLDKSILDEAAVNLLSLGDPTNGGFGHAPKFPNAANLSFMLRYSKVSGISKFQEFVLKTLTKMVNGGIYDQIGGGFHRYSTDSRWLVPHFEKMLYDNALLPLVYAEAYQLTRDGRFLNVIKETLGYVLKEMTSPEGAFYSAQDADSEGEEGKYYVWKKKEVQEILGADSDVFCLYYDIAEGGNFEGHTILNNNINLSTVAFNFGKKESEVNDIIKRCKEKLIVARTKRVPPGRDEKILVSWNALMISAFLKGYNHEKLIVRTKNIFDLSLPSGNSVATGALLRLYHITQEKKYLDIALKVMESLSTMAAENPFGFGQLLNVIYMYLQKPIEITIMNQDDSEICRYLARKFLPESILVSISKKERLDDLKQLPFFAGKDYDSTKTKVYICKDFTCSLPLET